MNQRCKENRRFCGSSDAGGDHEFAGRSCGTQRESAPATGNAPESILSARAGGLARGDAQKKKPAGQSSISKPGRLRFRLAVSPHALPLKNNLNGRLHRQPKRDDQKALRCAAWSGKPAS